MKKQAVNMTTEEAQFLLNSMPKLKKRVRVKSKAQSLNRSTAVMTCRYRADGKGDNTALENCCFIGYLIPPENYRSKFEGANCAKLDGLVLGLPAGKMSVEMIQFLVDLQWIHDLSRVNEWDAEFSKWAKTVRKRAKEVLTAVQ